MSAEWLRLAGIDPGRQMGFVALEVANNWSRWRLLGWDIFRPSTRATRTGAENKAALFAKAREALQLYRIEHLVIERPADVSGQWRPSQRKAGMPQQTGTGFGIGECYGLAVAAACAAGARRIFDYPVTSRKESKRGNRVKPARYGWMPQVRGHHGGLSFTQAREQTLRDLREHMRYLIDSSDELDYRLRSEQALSNENILMALGVARFHIQKRGEYTFSLATLDDEDTE